MPDVPEVTSVGAGAVPRQRITTSVRVVGRAGHAPPDRSRVNVDPAGTVSYVGDPLPPAGAVFQVPSP